MGLDDVEKKPIDIKKNHIDHIDNYQKMLKHILIAALGVLYDYFMTDF